MTLQRQVQWLPLKIQQLQHAQLSPEATAIEKLVPTEPGSGHHTTSPMLIGSRVAMLRLATNGGGWARRTLPSDWGVCAKLIITVG